MQARLARVAPAFTQGEGVHVTRAGKETIGVLVSDAAFRLEAEQLLNDPSAVALAEANLRALPSQSVEGGTRWHSMLERDARIPEEQTRRIGGPSLDRTLAGPLSRLLALLLDGRVFSESLRLRPGDGQAAADSCAAVFALTLTFLKDVSPGSTGAGRAFLEVGWVFYILSVVFGIATLMALAVNLEKPETGQDPSIYRRNIAIPAGLQVLFFFSSG